MFKWLHARRGNRQQDVSAETQEADRDSGEEELASEQELEDEAAPSGMTRVNTDEI
jgi:hypothetical protein